MTHQLDEVAAHINAMSIKDESSINAMFNQYLNRPETRTMLFDGFVSDPTFQTILKRPENTLKSTDRTVKSSSNERRLARRFYNGKEDYFLQQPVKPGFGKVTSIVLYSNHVQTGKKLTRPLGSMEIIIVPDMFQNNKMWARFKTIEMELKEKYNGDELFDGKRHGTSHSIIETTSKDLKNPNTKEIHQDFLGGEWYTKVKERMTRFFHDMEVVQDRVNHYAADEGKPPHQDAPANIGTAAYSRQNLTVAANFGREDNIVEFVNIFTGDIETFNIPGGSVYAFGEGVNLAFKHAVRKRNQVNLKCTTAETERISIVLWGKVAKPNFHNNSGWEFPDKEKLEEMKKTAL